MSGHRSGHSLMQVELLAKMHVGLCLWTLAFVLLSMAHINLNLCSQIRKTGRSVEDGYLGHGKETILAAWFCNGPVT